MSDEWSSLVAGVVGGLGGSAALVWLARSWITERLQQSIRHEYSQKLETHKSDLNARIQALNHEYQFRQLRTSLFFDHQRNAFAALTAKIAEVNDAWAKEHFDIDTGLTGPVPYSDYHKLREIFQQHQLFLDQEGVAAMELVFSSYSSSFPVHDGSGGQPHYPDPSPGYDRVRFLQPLIAELFRTKIGVSHDTRASEEIGILGAVLLLNQYHFPDIGLPPVHALKVESWDAPGEIVNKGRRNYVELRAGLLKLRDHLRSETGFFAEALTKAAQFLAMLPEKNDAAT